MLLAPYKTLYNVPRALPCHTASSQMRRFSINTINNKQGATRSSSFLRETEQKANFDSGVKASGTLTLRRCRHPQATHEHQHKPVWPLATVGRFQSSVHKGRSPRVHREPVSSPPEAPVSNGKKRLSSTYHHTTPIVSCTTLVREIPLAVSAVVGWSRAERTAMELSGHNNARRIPHHALTK